MKRNITMLLLFSLSLTAVCQTMTVQDSLRIASLEKQLATATGKSEVKLLNDLAWEYTWVSQKDKSLAQVYADRAKEKALKINDQRGVGYANLVLSWYHAMSPGISDSFCNTTLSIAEKLKDYKLLGRVHHRRWEMKEAFEYFRKAGDLQGEAEAATWLCGEYAAKGTFDSGFNYCQRALELANTKKTATPTYSDFISEMTYETLSDLYSKVGDYPTAFKYLEDAARYANRSGSDVHKQVAELYRKMGQYDSSLKYYELAFARHPDLQGLRRQVATANFLAGKYERAVELFEIDLEGARNYPYKNSLPFNWIGSMELELAESYLALNKVQLADQNFRLSLQHQESEYQKQLHSANPHLSAYQVANRLMEVSLGLSKAYFGIQNTDSAYAYLKKYTEYKDQVNNLNTRWRLYMQLSNHQKQAEDQKKTSQLRLLEKENQLSLVKLKQEKMRREWLVVAIAILLIAGAMFAGLIHQKRKSEKMRLQKEMEMQQLEHEQRQAELKRQAVELEMQALRAQMNPHFIFNCLSSINRFIFKNDNVSASDYLTRFSRLIRMVLIHSQKKLVPLEDEVEMLTLYLDMERMRFKNAFDYSITTNNSIDSGAIFIPPLLFQPFCENAIWHGLMNKEGQGHLHISIKEQNNILYCVITDNGVGRAKAAELKSKSVEKHKSLGLKITSARLELFNKINNEETSYHIKDVLDDNGNVAGTEVELAIHYKKSFEQHAYA